MYTWNKRRLLSFVYVVRRATVQTAVDVTSQDALNPKRFTEK